MKGIYTIAVLVSGRGSNLQSLYRASKQNRLFDIVAVITDNGECPAVEFAKQNNIPVFVIQDNLTEILNNINPKLVCLAGYMKLVPRDVVAEWKGKMINIHPSILPKYPGLGTHKKVIESGDKVHGATIHYVNEVVDGGDIIEQVTIPVGDSDTPETIAEKLLPHEHSLYVKVVENFAKGIII